MNFNVSDSKAEANCRARPSDSRAASTSSRSPLISNFIAGGEEMKGAGEEGRERGGRGRR